MTLLEKAKKWADRVYTKEWRYTPYKNEVDSFMAGYRAALEDEASSIESSECVCGHNKSQHIYEVAACRPVETALKPEEADHLATKEFFKEELFRAFKMAALQREL